MLADLRPSRNVELKNGLFRFCGPIEREIVMGPPLFLDFAGKLFVESINFVSSDNNDRVIRARANRLNLI